MTSRLRYSDVIATTTLARLMNRPHCRLQDPEFNYGDAAGAPMVLVHYYYIKAMILTPVDRYAGSP